MEELLEFEDDVDAKDNKHSLKKCTFSQERSRSLFDLTNISHVLIVSSYQVCSNSEFTFGRLSQVSYSGPRSLRFPSETAPKSYDGSSFFFIITIDDSATLLNVNMQISFTCI